MAEFDTIIKGGTIVDGTLVPPYHADIGIKDGKIAKIGRLKSSDAKQVLDASGLIVARALQKYGAFVGDFSGAMSLYAEASPSAIAAWNAGLLTTYEIKDQIDLNKFRVLQIGALFDNGN